MVACAHFINLLAHLHSSVTFPPCSRPEETSHNLFNMPRTPMTFFSDAPGRGSSFQLCILKGVPGEAAALGGISPHRADA